MMDERQFDRFRAVLPDLEASSYFDLADETKSLITSLQTNGHISFDAWSFVPHPDILERIKPMDRYIVTIDTITSQAYFPILAFLKKQNANVTAFYSGGWADFVCEIYFDETNFKRWFNELKDVLGSTDAEKFCGKRGVSSLISAFKVIETHILCRQPIAEIMRPRQSILKDIEKNPGQFEMVFRNYRSAEATQLFGGDEAVRVYLRRLKEEGAILCFRAITNIARFTAKDYVALRVRHRAVEGLLKEAQTNVALLEPVNDFLEVDAVHWADESEKEINHLFVNTYDFPGQRIDWKLKIYEWANPTAKQTLDVNLYNYPLEGSVKEAPIYLTDFPEFLERAKAYNVDENGSGIFIGRGSHPSISSSEQGPAVRLSVSGLAYHGVTLGGPGTGKTNTSLVLATHTLPHVRNVIILDGTEGVSSKLEGLPPNIADNITRITLDEAHSPKSAFKQAMTKTGLVILEFSGDTYHPWKVLETAIDLIEDRKDSVKGTQPRAVQHVLIVEEAADLWLGKKAQSLERARKLIRFLEKAWRKGWCIWLSTQRISSLGPDEDNSESLFELLKNRIIHGVGTVKEETLFLNLLKEEGHIKEDLEYVQRQIRSRIRGFALVRGVIQDGKDATPLPPIYVTIPLLQDTLTKSL